MKKIISLAIFTVLTAAAAFAQDSVTDATAAAAQAIADTPENVAPAPKPVYWKESIQFDFGFNQTAMWNWQAGGDHTISLAAGVDARADYAKGLISWNNRLQLNYGFMWVKGNRTPFQKNSDRIYLESRWGRDMSQKSKWKYSASFDFRTQFSDGYDYSKGEEIDGVWNSLQVSDFLAPAYTNLALGLEWKPNNWFDLNLAPVTGGIVICTRPEDLRASYGMPLVDKNDADSGRRPVLFQFGTQLKANAKAAINDKFMYETQLVMFYDYLFDYKNPTYDSRFPVRVNWDNKISWTISKLFRIGLDTWLIYDPLVVFNITEDNPVGDHKVQFKEFLSINFTYSIASKK